MDTLSATTAPSTLTVRQGLDKFVADAQALLDAHMESKFPTLPRKLLTVEPGRKYVRVVISDINSGNHRSVYCFVDLTNGDVLKSESWKKPAKHARGNVLTYKNVSECVGPYGAHYLV